MGRAATSASVSACPPRARRARRASGKACNAWLPAPRPPRRVCGSVSRPLCAVFRLAKSGAGAARHAGL